jgi:ADP-heptose:LPS heptosyltransferase
MHLLVIRTSAMGDVALLTPVIEGMKRQFPDVRITLLTRKTFESFFYSIDKLDLFLPDFKKQHKGLAGIFRLFNDLKGRNIDAVIDLHDVLRSKILRLLFHFSGLPVYVIDKGRKDKRRIIKGKRRTGLKHSVLRYRDVFAEAGFDVVPADPPCIIPSDKGLAELSSLKIDFTSRNIGIAPFARHKLKMWPEENMIRLLELISASSDNVKFWFFGGFEELEQLKDINSKVAGSEIVTGRLTLAGEIALMSKLEFMLSMDSSNMHMAALAGIKVISIWGGTDPLAGFGAWRQPENYSIRIPAEELGCRPCTVYGKGKCRRGDFACMNWLTPEKVYSRMVNLKII